MDIESEMILAEKTCRSCDSANENKNLFCWNCGLFLPASLAKAKRESIYRESATCDPLAMYQKMKDKQTVNRSYNPIKCYVSFRSILIDKIAKLVKGLNHQLIALYSPSNSLHLIPVNSPNSPFHTGSIPSPLLPHAKAAAPTM